MNPLRAEVSLDAIRHNVALIRDLADGAEVCAVVKADAYGHGALDVAVAALDAGATWLAVATPAEAIVVGEAVPADTPMLLLSEPDPVVLAHAWPELPSGIRFTAASEVGVAALTALGGAPTRVHMKVDTGMHRVGVAPADAVALASSIADDPALQLEGIWTHCAVADEPDDPFTAEQLRRFDAALADVLGTLATRGIQPPMTHVANSAGAIAHPTARRDMVRLGIAMYGVPPSPTLAGAVNLRPALRLVSTVTGLRTVESGETVSYGRRWTAERATRIATVPAGYADGIRRSSGAAGVEVLIGGRRRPIVGTVTMDQLMVVVDDRVELGDEVVLIGRQGDEEVTATEIADRLGTIGYEVLTDLGPRVERDLR